MANRQTREPNWEDLNRCIGDAKGKDRSLRDYATAAGVHHNIFYRISKKEYRPGFDILRKLADAADPKSKVTLMDFLKAAGFPNINFEGLEKGAKLLGAAARIVKPQVDFHETAFESISKSLSEMHISFEVDPDKAQIIGFDPLGRLILHDEPICALWFRSWYAESENDYGGLGCSQDKAIDLLREPLILDPDPLRKYVIAVNSREVYDDFCIYAGKNSYRGWLSAILIDSEKKEILAETTLSSFSGRKDDLDPLTLTNK